MSLSTHVSRVSTLTRRRTLHATAHYEVSLAYIMLTLETVLWLLLSLTHSHALDALGNVAHVDRLQEGHFSPSWTHAARSCFAAAWMHAAFATQGAVVSRQAA